jgi:hypothetical protein
VRICMHVSSFLLNNNYVIEKNRSNRDDQNRQQNRYVEDNNRTNGYQRKERESTQLMRSWFGNISISYDGNTIKLFYFDINNLLCYQYI